MRLCVTSLVGTSNFWKLNMITVINNFKSHCVVLYEIGEVFV